MVNNMELDKIGQLILSKDLETALMDVKMGIEVEMHRVFKNGKLSNHEFPEELGEQEKNRRIKNDFFNMQSEIITPTAANAAEAIRDLTALNYSLRSALKEDEVLWPLSLPPILPENLNTLEISHVSPEKEKYYHEWLSKHDIRRALPTGVHVNLSFDSALINSLYAYVRNDYTDKSAIRNALFEKVTHGFIKYSWLLTYLFGATPISEQNFYVGSVPDYPVRSLRGSREYGLFSDFRGNYSSIHDYEKAILVAIDSEEIQSESEFHGPIRLKSLKGLRGMAQNGVDYMELRMLDLDPTSSIGIRSSTVRFIRLLVMYFVMNEDDWQESDQLKAEKMNEKVALEPAQSMTGYQNEAINMMNNLQNFVKSIGLSVNMQRTLNELNQRVINPSITLSAQLCNEIEDNSLIKYAISRAEMYQNGALQDQRRVYKKSLDGQDVTDEELQEILFDQDWQHIEYPKNIS